MRVADSANFDGHASGILVTLTELAELLQLQRLWWRGEFGQRHHNFRLDFTPSSGSS